MTEEIISVRKIRNYLGSKPTSKRHQKGKAYFIVVQWFNRLESVLDRLDQEHPVWIIDRKLTYLGPFFGGGKHVWVILCLRHCTLTLDVSIFEDSKVELWIDSREIVVSDDLEESLRSVLTRARLGDHIKQSWSN